MLELGQPQDYLQDTPRSSFKESDIYTAKCMSKSTFSSCQYSETLPSLMGLNTMLRPSPYSSITLDLEKEITYYKTQFEEIRADRDQMYRRYQSMLESHQAEKMQIQEKIDSASLMRNQCEREIELLDRTLNSNHMEKEDQSKYLAEKRETILDIEACVRESENILQKTRQVKKDHEIMWMELNTKLNDCVSEVGRAAKTVSQYKGKVSDLVEKNDELMGKTQEISETLANMERKNKCLETSLHESGIKLNHETVILKEKVPKRDTLAAGNRAIEASLKNTLLEISDIQDEVESLEKELLRKESHMKELEETAKGLRDHQSQLHHEIACLTKDGHKVNMEMNVTQEKCEMLQAEELRCKMEINNMEKIISQKDEEKYQLLEELQQLKEENSYIMIRKSNVEETHRNLAEELKKLQLHIDPAVNTSEVQDKEIDRLTSVKKHNQEEITRLHNHLLILNENINNGFEHLDNLQKDLQSVKNSNAKIIVEIEQLKRKCTDGDVPLDTPCNEMYCLPVVLPPPDDYTPSVDGFRPRLEKDCRREAGSINQEDRANYMKQCSSQMSDGYLDVETKKFDDEQSASPVVEQQESYRKLSGKEYWSMYREARKEEDNCDASSVVDDKASDLDVPVLPHHRRDKSDCSLTSNSVMSNDTSEDKELHRMAKAFSYTNGSESVEEDGAQDGYLMTDQSNATMESINRGHRMYESMDSLASLSEKNDDYPLQMSREQRCDSELVLGNKSDLSSINGDLSMIEDSSLGLSIGLKEDMRRQKQNFTPCSFNSSDIGDELSETVHCESLVLDHTPCSKNVMRFRNRFQNVVGSEKTSFENLDHRIFGGTMRVKN